MELGLTEVTVAVFWMVAGAGSMMLRAAIGELAELDTTGAAGAAFEALDLYKDGRRARVTARTVASEGVAGVMFVDTAHLSVPALVPMISASLKIFGEDGGRQIFLVTVGDTSVRHHPDCPEEWKGTMVTHFTDPNGSAWLRLGIQGLPGAVLFDEDGNIKKKGRMDWEPSVQGDRADSATAAVNGVTRA